MSRYIAFLRAINVGGHIVKMDHLRGLFESIGFRSAETFIASGNVIFDAASKNTRALEKKIEDCLHRELGYEVSTFIRSSAEVAAITAYKPFRVEELNGDGNVIYIALLADRPSLEAKRKLLSLANSVDDFHVHHREAYWLRRRKIGESRFSGALLERALGMRATIRNSTTINKIAAKY